LLGQNVDSYKWNVDAKGNVKDADEPVVRFAQLMDMVSDVNPDLRVRFSTSHPKDMTDEVLEVMARKDNLCKYIHLPVQSGDSGVLKRMNRGYTREWYLNRIAAIRRIMPDCAISTDVISGFCGETLEEHEATLSLMKEVRYEMAYMFKYSERPRTLAERKFEDDVPEEEKGRRLAEVIDLQRVHSRERMAAQCGPVYRILVEGPSKKDSGEYQGRNTYNGVVVFPKGDAQIGEYVYVRTTKCMAVTLRGELISEQEAQEVGYIA
jgi:tRNA-2-methylthio-N6-dimethylallyladenosine synthase